eukprot:g3104.t1
MLFIAFLTGLLSVQHILARDILYEGQADDISAAIANTAQFNSDLANLNSGDKLLIPNKTFYVAGGIQGSNLFNVTIQLDGTLKFLPGRSHWPTTSCLNKSWIPLQPRPKKQKSCVKECFKITDSSFVTFTSSSENFQGTLHGNGQSWWGYIQYLLHGEDRPRLFLMINVTEVLVERWSFLQSPYWTFTAFDVRDLEISHCNVDNRINRDDSHDIFNLDAFNTDGFDVAGRNIHIHDSSVWNQDDCFTIQPLDASGFNANCTENVLVENVYASGLGLTVGAIHPNPNHTCIKNVTFRNAYMHHTYKGIYVKTGNSFDASASGELTNILYENITMDSPGQVPIWIGPAQEADSKGACSLLWPTVNLSHSCPPPPTTMKIANITLNDVLITNPKQSPGVIFGNPKTPIQNVVFNNVVVTPTDKSKKPWKEKFYFCKGIANGRADQSTNPVPPCFRTRNPGE